MAKSNAERQAAHRERTKLLVEDTEQFVNVFLDCLDRSGQTGFYRELDGLPAGEVIRALSVMLADKKIVITTPKKR